MHHRLQLEPSPLLSMPRLLLLLLVMMAMVLIRPLFQSTTNYKTIFHQQQQSWRGKTTREQPAAILKRKPF
jgi:hypothetical protein